MRDALEMLGLRTLAVLANAPPPAAALACGRALGRFAFALGVRRRVCLQNLERAFPGSEQQVLRQQLGRAAYEHLGMLAVEFLRLPRLRAEERRSAMDLVGAEHLQAAAASGRGAILATAHYGNWELLGAGMVAHGFPLTLVVQRLRNPRAEALVGAVRTAVGERAIERGMGLRRLRSELEANRFVAVLTDQDARRRGAFVPFFGSLASTPKGAVQLAWRLEVPLLPVLGHRLPGGRHCLTVHPPLPLRRDLPEEEVVHQTLLRFNALLEAAIRAAPSQYLWLHRRWKTPAPVAAPA